MIRPAEKRDIPELYRLLGQVNNVHAEGRPDLFVMNSSKYTPEELDALLDDPNYPVFVCTEDDRAVQGYAFCQRQHYAGDHNMVDRREIYIDDICVDAAVRGQHVGTRLYDHVVAWAEAQGYDRITLNVWSLNPTAMAFYQSLGMTPFKVGMEQKLPRPERSR